MPVSLNSKTLSIVKSTQKKHNHTSPDKSSITSEPISGQVYARVGWGKAPDGTVLSPSPSAWRPPNSSASMSNDPLREVMDSDGKLDTAKLEAWIVKSQIDPNDPENEELMTRVAEARRKADLGAKRDGQSKDSSGAVGDFFRLDDHLDQFVFGKSDFMDKNMR